jgi:membrane protease YdiL (CAAX protease family)
VKDNQGYIKHAKRFLLFYLVIITCYLLLHKLANKQTTLELFMGQIGLAGLLLAFFPGCRENAPGSSGKFSVRATLMCIFTGIAVSIVNTIYIDEIAKYGASVAPGYNQLRIPACTAAIDAWIYGAVAVFTAPFLEEYFFRHIILGKIHGIIAASPSISKQRQRLLIIIAAIATSVLFALAHRPGLPIFPVYLLSGIAYSYTYLKRGFPGAVIAHSTGNAFVLFILSFI